MKYILPAVALRQLIKLERKKNKHSTTSVCSNEFWVSFNFFEGLYAIAIAICITILLRTNFY